MLDKILIYIGGIFYIIAGHIFIQFFDNSRVFRLIGGVCCSIGGFMLTMAALIN